MSGKLPAVNGREVFNIQGRDDVSNTYRRYQTWAVFDGKSLEIHGSKVMCSTMERRRGNTWKGSHGYIWEGCHGKCMVGKG